MCHSIVCTVYHSQSVRGALALDCSQLQRMNVRL